MSTHDARQILHQKRLRLQERLAGAFSKILPDDMIRSAGASDLPGTIFSPLGRRPLHALAGAQSQ